MCPFSRQLFNISLHCFLKWKASLITTPYNLRDGPSLKWHLWISAEHCKGEWPFNSCQWYLLLHWRIAFHIKMASDGALTLYWKFCFCVTGLRLISLERSPNVLPDQFYRLDPFGRWYKMWIKILGNLTEYYVEKKFDVCFFMKVKKKIWKSLTA